MGRKKKEEKNIAVSITVAPDLHEQLTAYADKDERSISYVVVKALKEFFEKRKDGKND